MERVITLVDKLAKSHVLSREEFSFLLDNIGEEDSYLYEKAREAALANYGNKIYVRGLMEFTNYCKNDCYYCGIRRSNQKASRYRLSPEQIMECCSIGYGLGFRTFVLQGGEDPWFTDEKIAYLVERMKKQYPDCAVTLSVGEKGTIPISAGLMRVQTAICFAMKQPIRAIMPVSIRLRCLLSTGRNVCIT